MQINPLMFAEEGIKKVVETFERYQADSIRLVGGCVRDAIMGREVNDIDFATPLTPDVVTAICEKAGFHVEPTGIDHGTVTAIWNHEPYEITTLRRDVETDGRRAVVAFTTDWEEDAYRRDFTFNALYLAPDGTVYDYNGGIEDARLRRIRFMGDAEQRIREDYLRILRAFRFQSVLVGYLDEEAEAAIAKHKDGIDTLSGERLEKEIIKLLNGEAYDVALRLMADTGMFEKVFGLPNTDVDGMVERLRFYEGVRKEVGNLPRLAVALGWRADVAERLLDRWKAGGLLRAHVLDVLQKGPLGPDVTDHELRKVAFRQGVFVAKARLALTYVNDGLVPDGAKARLDTLEQPRFPLQGRDVLALGVKPGREVGEVLRRVEARWVDADFPQDGLQEWLKEEVS